MAKRTPLPFWLPLVAGLTLALCEPTSLPALRGAMPLAHLLPSGAAWAVPGDTDNDSYPKNTDGFYLYPAEDCNDVNPTAHPFAAELCNGLVDDDCDGCRDESCPDGVGGTRPAFCDADGDGVDSQSDCNNLNASISPDATEICNNGIDDDCNGAVDGADARCEDAPTPGVTWHLLDQPAICLLNPLINPDLVTIPDANPGCLPTPASGDRAYWFGGDARGSFLGDDAELPQTAKNGGTSAVGKIGTLTSPSFGPTTAEGRVNFKSWWEIESVDPSSYDLMSIVAVDLGGGETPVVNLNPLTDPGWGEAELHYASGYNLFLNEAAVVADPFLAPTWQSYTVALPAGTSRVRFRFNAGDELYNGFRGWMLDDFEVTDALPGSPTGAGLASPLGSVQTPIFADNFDGPPLGWTTGLQVGTEDCDNCADDDGDGLIDLLDPSCGAPQALDVKSANLGLKPEENEDRITAMLIFPGAADSIDPPSEGVTFAVLDPAAPNKAIACVQIPAGSPGWKVKGSTWSFKDAKDSSLGDPEAKETLTIKHNSKKGLFTVTVKQKMAEVTGERVGALATELVIGNDSLLNQQGWGLNKKGTKLSTK